MRKILERVLYPAYLLICIAGAALLFRATMPERWESLFWNEAEVLPLPVGSTPPPGEILSPNFVSKANGFHKFLVNGRWPIGSYRYNAGIGFELTPGFCGVTNNGAVSKSVCVHELGYRISPEQDPHSFRQGGVLSIGCSFTYGDLVESSETFTQRIADSLGLEGYNFGVPSYSYASSIVQLRQLHERGVLDELAPSIVVLGAGGWLKRRSLSPFPPSGSGPRYTYAFIDRLGDKAFIAQPDEIYSSKYVFDMRAKYFTPDPLDKKFTSERQHLLQQLMPTAIKADRARRSFPKSTVTDEQLYEFILVEIQHLAQAHDMQFVVLWQFAEKYPDLPQSLLEAARAHDDVLLVDTTGSASDNHEGLFYSGHPTALLNERFAKLVVEEIRSASK